MSSHRLNLLLINWQDIRNPQAGGAEIHLHEIFGRLARDGHVVTLLCSGWPDCPAREEVDGMSVHRVAGRHTFALQAAPYYLKHLRGQAFDLVVEDINKIPLYSPLWARPPVVALIPHLFGATAFQEASLPMATAVWIAERPVPFIYEGIPFQAISESTADDLAERGLPRSSVRVIHPGIDHDRFRPEPEARRYERPTFVYVGRLKRYKGLEYVIEAVARLAKEGIDLRLVVAGKGDHETALRAYAGDRAADRVEFLGYISEDEKLELLRKCWATVYPSPKEGWGITNVEAAASGTPALASDSPGLRESVAHEVSGLLVRHGDVSAWATALRRIALDADLRARLQAGARSFADQFSWDRTANETEAHLLEVLSQGPDRGHASSHTPGLEVA
ncbi:MAG: glycosyltransferase family 4 protein [Gemmatimonadetes bacterium]|uniref:Glycosyltransferase family 4 protein n=1 Tax=Candidatus Kutchimonas denitrificans TaxID=3056748 RepID=A0AAE4Z9D5_9BACT|nr:glycosyltransferase family 4 protein [Gemmatimonadota bacterium]NIR75694.1 glycosyltransferase family 4 protein [Candidatus Kutchimonas denitrificans]NIS00307.1 glycosyltransferase family 4 protein [Gemmatimonadota bacterium]NIT65966.1 glycosyltransferase family 4 protein [Gemmatimonadota bacterium]NIU53670.1 glycosyltransferase [Gemmatimonadota bacterium]